VIQASPGVAAGGANSYATSTQNSLPRPAVACSLESGLHTRPGACAAGLPYPSTRALSPRVMTTADRADYEADTAGRTRHLRHERSLTR
jgi:hypothetical protein